MQIVIHRINTIGELKKIPPIYGIEIDLRAEGSRLVLNHEPFCGGENFVDYLAEYHHRLLVLNIKEAGIESEVIWFVKERNILDYFLLDVEFPYIYQSSRKGQRNIAIRYSEDEPIQAALQYRNRVDWVWIDTNTKLPLDAAVIQNLRGFKTCLVCPGRWGRSRDIPGYRQKMKQLGFEPNAVMTAFDDVSLWEQPVYAG
jgi:hypothetical protein